MSRRVYEPICPHGVRYPHYITECQECMLLEAYAEADALKEESEDSEEEEEDFEDS